MTPRRLTGPRPWVLYPDMKPRCRCGLRIAIDPYGLQWVHLSDRANRDHYAEKAWPLDAR